MLTGGDTHPPDAVRRRRDRLSRTTVPGSLSSMSSDTKWIIGTMLAGMTAMTALLLTVIVSLVGDVRADVRRMDDRLRTVEIAFGKVDQRLATLERLHLPTPAPPGPAD